MPYGVRNVAEEGIIQYDADVDYFINLEGQAKGVVYTGGDVRRGRDPTWIWGHIRL